jgi:anti-anti-sigma factor
MERHQVMAGSVCTRSDGAIGSVANRSQTAFTPSHNTEDQYAGPARSEASFAPVSLARRMHTLILTGSLDGGSAHMLEVEIERLCEEGVAGITVDLRELDHIDPIGVAVLAFRCGLCIRRGYEFALIRGSRAIGRAFEQAGVSELLPFQDEPQVELAVEEEQVALRQPLIDEQPALRQAPALVLTRFEAVASGEL